MLKFKTTFEGDWKKLERFLRALDRKSSAILDRVMKKEAKRLTRALKTRIRKGGNPAFKPLSPFSIAIRRATGQGGRKPLLRTGALLRSIRDHKIGSHQYFAGVRKGTPYQAGRTKGDAAAVALTVEMGRGPIVLNLDRPSSRTGKTPRQWFWWLYLQGAINSPPRKTTTHIVLGRQTERPFVRQTHVLEGRESGPRMQRAWEAELEKAFAGGSKIVNWDATWQSPWTL